MVIKVGINGFGRIGRIMFRTCILNPDVEVAAVNDPAVDVEYICYLIKFDSIHGKFEGDVAPCKGDIQINGNLVKIFRAKQPCDVPWNTAGVQYVIESSGMFTNLEKAAGHLSVEGVKRVVVTAPSSDVPMIILGVNDDKLRADQRVISCASSTLYCLAPIMKVLENNYGVSEGFVTSIHAMTPSLKPLDGLCLRGKHWRDFRSIHQNVIPAMTGACKALGKILPELKDKMIGLAFRVPIVNVSVLDLTIRLSKKTTLENIVKNVENASETYLQEVLNISKEEAVSSDFIRDSHSCILDVNSSLQLRPDFYKLICWYENEFSYACRVMDLITFCERRFEQKQTLEGKIVDGVTESPKLTDTAVGLKRFKPAAGTCRQQIPNTIKTFSKSVYSSLQDLQPWAADVSVVHQGTFTDRQPKKVNELLQVPTVDNMVKNVSVSTSIQNIEPTSSASKVIEAKPSVNKNVHKSTKHERNDFFGQNHLESVRKELNKMMNVTQGLLEKSNRLCDPFKFKFEDQELKKNKADRCIAFVESNESMQCTGCLTKSQETFIINKQLEKACSGRGDTKNDNARLMSVEHSALTEDAPKLHDGDDISKFHVKTLYDTNFEEIADSRHAGELVQKRAITKLQKTSTSFLRENPYVYAFNKKHEFRNDQLKKQLQKSSPVSIKMEGLNLAGNEAHCSENISRYIIVQETENTKNDRKFLGQRLVGKQNILVQKQVICENVALHSNDNNNDFVKKDANKTKQDIFDKLDSTSATNSENSFHVKEKQSQVICINDLTNSLEDLSRLEKICKIIEISDDLSDELFSKLKPTEATCMKNKKWSFKDLCAKIKLDDFCDKVFRE